VAISGWQEAPAQSSHGATGGVSGYRTRATLPRCPKRNVATGSIALGNTAFQRSSTSGVWPGSVVQSVMFDADANERLFAEMATQIPTVWNGGIRDGGKTYVIHLKPGNVVVERHRDHLGRRLVWLEDCL
jgi:hypothetical protein